MKRLLKYALRRLGYEVYRPDHEPTARPVPEIPDGACYKPLFRPWDGVAQFMRSYDRIRPFTLVSPDRCYILSTLAKQAVHLHADIWECGVYKGGTAMLLAEVIRESAGAELHLFDTFEGMPKTNPEHDIHQQGDFRDTSLDEVQRRVSPAFARFHAGRIPETFAGLENRRIALAHVDVDIYQSVLDCCEFIHPRLVPGGFLIFDDYGFPSCPGARRAVDEYFEHRPERPLVLPTGQAIVFASF